MPVSITFPDNSGATTPTQASPATGPLSTLYKTSGISGNIFTYPYDLGSSSKNHYVKFWVKQIVSQGVGTSSSGQDTKKNGGQKLFTELIQPQTYDPVAAICLYMPDTLNASYSASYDELSLTNELGGGLNGIQAIRSFLGAGPDKNSGSSIASDSALQYGKSKVAGGLAGLVGGNSQTLADVDLQGRGVVINPQLQMLYRGVGFRQFQLSFIFTPASASEAQTINNIIGTFKYHFAPDLLVGAESDNGMFFIPPSFFNIEFMINSAENVFLPKYGDCVLSEIDVNYAPNGFAAHIDGAPVQTQLNLTFKEIEIVTKGKLQAGFFNNAYSGSGSVGGLR